MKGVGLLQYKSTIFLPMILDHNFDEYTPFKKVMQRYFVQL